MLLVDCPRSATPMSSVAPCVADDDLLLTGTRSSGCLVYCSLATTTPVPLCLVTARSIFPGAYPRSLVFRGLGSGFPSPSDKRRRIHS